MAVISEAVLVEVAASVVELSSAVASKEEADSVVVLVAVSAEVVQAPVLTDAVVVAGSVHLAGVAVEVPSEGMEAALAEGVLLKGATARPRRGLLLANMRTLMRTCCSTGTRLVSRTNVRIMSFLIKI